MILIFAGIITTQWWVTILGGVYILGISIWKKDWKILGFLVIFLIPPFLTAQISKTNVNEEHYHEAIVVEVHDDSLIVREDGERYYINVYDDQVYNVGDTISFEATYDKPDDLGFYTYLRAKGTEYSATAYDVTIESDKGDWYNWTRNAIYTNVMTIDSMFADFASVMFYGTPTEDAEPLDEAITHMGINHLFVISGFHIALLLTFVDKGLGKVKRLEGKDDLRFFLGSALGLFFLYLIFSPWAAQRAWLYKNLSYFNTRNYWDLTNNDVLSLVGITFLWLNPFSMYTMSLILSFGITFLINTIMNTKLTKIWKTVFIALGAFTLAIPFLSTFNESFNIIAPLHTLILTPIISFTYGLMIILLPFWFLWWLMYPILWVLLAVLWFFNLLVVTVHVEPKNFIGAILMMIFTFYSIFALKDHPWSMVGIFILEIIALGLM